VEHAKAKWLPLCRLDSRHIRQKQFICGASTMTPSSLFVLNVSRRADELIFPRSAEQDAPGLRQSSLGGRLITVATC